LLIYSKSFEFDVAAILDRNGEEYAGVRLGYSAVVKCITPLGVGLVAALQAEASNVARHTNVARRGFGCITMPLPYFMKSIANG
jgi:hypothetical protein